MRLIDADALLGRIPNPYEQAEVARWVNKQPTAEPMRKKGEWIDGSIPTYAVCSECGYQERYAYENNFCPNCGCQMMRGDADEMC